MLMSRLWQGRNIKHEILFYRIFVFISCPIYDSVSRIQMKGVYREVLQAYKIYYVLLTRMAIRFEGVKKGLKFMIDT